MKKVDLLLINPPSHQRNGSSLLFPLGLGYIMSAVENAGYNYGFIDCSKYITSYYKTDLDKLKQCLEKDLSEYNPGLVGIGPCITTQVKALKIIIDCCKSIYNEDMIVAGGPLTSINGQDWIFNEYFKINNIIRGDGEKAIIDALKHVKQGSKISNSKYITTKEKNVFNEITDVDSIAFPIRIFNHSEKISVRRKSLANTIRTASMVTSRGCPYKCRYCVSGNIAYSKYRKRSFLNIIKEMEILRDCFCIEDIIFYDDCFFYNLKKANDDVTDFCSLLKAEKINMTWQMEIRPDLLIQLNKESFMSLENSGCRQINIGIEKTDIEGLKYLGKNISIADLSQKISVLKKNTNICVAGTFILGGLNETRKDILKTIEDSINMNLDFAHYNPLFVYPGTPIYNEVFSDKKDWLKYILNDLYPWGEIVYENNHLKKDQLLELIDYAYSLFYANSKHQNSFMITDRFNLKRGNENEAIR